MNTNDQELPDKCPKCGAYSHNSEWFPGRYTCSAFVTSTGEFIDREGACKIARLTNECEQLRKRLEQVSDDETWARSRGVTWQVSFRNQYGFGATTNDALRALREKIGGAK